MLDNAVTRGAGDVRLSATRLGPGVIVEVADQGATVVDPDEVFIRRSTAAAGSGIGLALARRLAVAEDMRLVLTHPGPGVTFHLVSPAHHPPGSDDRGDPQPSGDGV